VCFAGKGGVGKTTSLVLFLKYAISKHPNLKKLVIDADPDANIADLVGKNIEFHDTIGGKVTEIGRKIARKEIPSHLSERSLIEEEVLRDIFNMGDFDLLVQGRSEGEGCYCSINSILKNLLRVLSETYDLIVIDSPAGLEFFARKTSTNVDDLVIVSDMSKMGFHTVQRIIEIKNEVSLDFKKIWILGNRFNEKSKELFVNRIKEILENNAELLGFFSYNDEIQKFNLSNKSLIDLPDTNLVYKESIEIYSKII